jgi:translation elongation factor EF-Tu-like GTPase
MLKVFGRVHQIKPGEWQQSYEILHEGHIVGYVDHKKTSSASVTMTRNLRGEAMEGERLSWLLYQGA